LDCCFFFMMLVGVGCKWGARGGTLVLSGGKKKSFGVCAVPKAGLFFVVCHQGGNVTLKKRAIRF